MRHEPILRLTRHGERLRVPADLRYTSVTAFLLRDGTEPELYRLEQFLRPGDTFLDVGANIGLFALKAARIVGPGGRVVAAEPGRVSADRLEANLLLNDYKQIQVLREALSDSEGTANLHHIELGHDPQAFSLLSDGSVVAAETVPTTTLDRLSQRLGLTRLDCVKMDVEGAEPMVIAGGRATLARFRPLVIFEINSPPALHTGKPAAASQALQALGYQLHELRGSALMPLAEQPLTLGNLVAIHPEGIQPLSFQQ
jgi:FkbM family methyltransferase